MPNPLPTPTPPKASQLAQPMPPPQPVVAPPTPVPASSVPPVAPATSSQNGQASGNQAMPQPTLRPPSPPISQPPTAPGALKMPAAPTPLAQSLPLVAQPQLATPKLATTPQQLVAPARPPAPLPNPGSGPIAPVALPVPPKSGMPPLTPRPPMPGAPGAPLPPRSIPPGNGPRPPGMPQALAGAAGPQVTPPPGQPAAAQPQLATPTPSFLKRFLPFIVGGAVLLGVVALALAFLPGLLGGGAPSTPNGTTNTGKASTAPAPRNQTALTYWGLWEPSQVMEQVFKDFEQANPGVKVEYVKQSHLDYRQRLQTAIAQGTGPDIYRFHASWTPMLKDDLASIPSNIYSATTFQNTFYPVAYQQLQAGGQLRGIPLMYDGLALYYNEDLLKAANAEVPKTWAELRILADSLTVRASGNVERGGLAIGNATNVEHFSDILGLLMLQNGADPGKPTSNEAEQALIFYTDFIEKYNVWSDTLPNSTVAFARGDVAMMFAPSWRAHEILAQNPNLKFGIAPVPQLGERQITWASYWAEGVNAKSKNKDASWKLLSYLSSAEVMKKLHGQQATTRRFGELYARKDLANELVNEPLAVAFLSDAPSAKGWYLSSFTHDNGLNDLTIKYYQDAITAVLRGGTEPKTALQTVGQGLNQVLRQFGVVTQSSSQSQQ